MELCAAVVATGWLPWLLAGLGQPTPAANSMAPPPIIAIGTTATAVTRSAASTMATSAATRPRLTDRCQFTYCPPGPARCH